jgi:hypothetical protein
MYPCGLASAAKLQSLDTSAVKYLLSEKLDESKLDERKLDERKLDEKKLNERRLNKRRLHKSLTKRPTLTLTPTL